jgi:hypothetical protein
MTKTFSPILLQRHVFIGSDSIMMDKLSRLMPARAAKIVYSQTRALLPTQ